MNLYLDQDGVLADFNKGCELAGVNHEHSYIHLPKEQWTDEQKALDAEVQAVMSKPGFFRELPMMTGAVELVKAASEMVGRKIGPVVLTALPNNPETAVRVSREKRDWISEHFYDDIRNVITCLRSKKVLYAPGNVLVDDLPQNILEWTNAGGIGILHTSAENSIKELRRIEFV